MKLPQEINEKPVVKRHQQSVSEFFSYKEFRSNRLLELVDDEYCFIWVNMGSNMSASNNKSSLQTGSGSSTVKHSATYVTVTGPRIL